MEPIQVFCSYRSVDKERVLAIAGRLRREQGIDAWVDSWEILPGEPIVGKIDEGIETSDVALIFLSAATLDSEWVRTEMGALLHRWVETKKRLIPVFLDGEVPLPPLLRSLKAIPAEPFDGLVRAIRGELGRPPLGPPPATERIFRISLASPGERELAVSATLDGREVAAPVLTRLGPDFAFSYRGFLSGHLPGSRLPGAAAELDFEVALAQLGEAVGAAVFAGAVGEALETALAEAKGAAVPLALEFATAEPRLLSIPFEAARLPDGAIPALLPSVRVFRRDLRPRAAASGALGPGPLSILVAVGAPDEGKTKSAVLDLEAELGAILDAVDKARRGPAFVRILEVGHPDEIEKALAERAYHVLHLSGHGKQGEIELEAEDGEPFPTSAESLAAALQRSGKRVPLVFLACCHGGVGDAETASLAQGLLENGVQQVLAMQTSVSDRYSIALAGRFYERLMAEPLASRALAAARQGAEEERRLKKDPPPPEYATPALFLAGDEVPLFDTGLPAAETPSPAAPAGGAVPRLKIGELIGRRKELRQILRILRDDPRAIAEHGRRAGVALLGMGGVGKSALAGRVMESLVEGGWRAVVVEGSVSLGELAQKAAAALDGSGEELKPLVERLGRPDQPDTARLAALAELLADHGVLLVLDNFETNLALGGESFVEPTLPAVLRELGRASGRGKLLLTCRYPVPGTVATLVPFPLGPLSPAEVRKLLYRLPRLAGQEGEALRQVLTQIGGHPRMLEYLDALLNAGIGRLPVVTEKLADCAARAAIEVGERGIGFDEAFHAVFWLGAQDIFLAELLELVGRQEGDREILEQLAVFPLPVERRELAWALADSEPAEGDDGRALAAPLRRLAQLSLVTPLEGGFTWVHRWTAEALGRERLGEALCETCRRAGEAVMGRARRTKNVEDGKEAARLFLRAEAWARAIEEIWPILNFLRDYGHLWDAAGFAEEVLASFPEDNDNFPGLLRECGDAYRNLGEAQGAGDRYRQALEISERLATAEPQRADYQRDLATSYSRMGNLSAALGQGEEARHFYQGATDVMQRLAAAEPQRADYQRDLSISYEKMGDLLRSLGKGEEARHFCEQDLEIVRRLVAAEPQRADYQRDLSVSFERMGDLLVALGEAEEARGFYQDAHDVSRRLAAAEPQRADYQRDLAVSFMKMMSIDPENAAEHARNAEAILRRLKERGALLPPDEPLLRALETVLAGGGAADSAAEPE